MFDMYSLQLANLRNELFVAEAVKSYQSAQTIGRPLRMPLGRRVEEALGNILIETGTRLKEQACSRTETAPSPTFLITL